MLAIIVSHFEAHPDVVTEILQLTPTASARVGDPTPSGNHRHRCNSWSYDVHPDGLPSGGEHDSALDAVVALLAPRVANFERLGREVRPGKLQVYGGIYLQPDAQAGLWLSRDQMTVLAACGVEWGVDLFIRDER